MNLRRLRPRGLAVWGAAAALASALAGCADPALEPDHGVPHEDDPGGETAHDADPGGGRAPDTAAAFSKDGGAGDVGPGASPPRDARADAAVVALPDAARASDALAPANQPLLKSGLHPDASDALRSIGITAAQITQTIGYVAASAGTHAPDGTVNGLQYSAATDLSVRGVSDADVKLLLRRLHSVGFAAWFRNPGYDGWPASEARHVHAVYAGCPMKRILRDQIRDFLDGRNGLASHAVYAFFQAAPEHLALVRKMFLAHNPASG